MGYGWGPWEALLRRLGGGGGGWVGGLELGDAFDHVAYGADGSEGVVGDFDVEGFFDLEGDVDLVEGVDVEFIEGAGKGDGVGRDALGLGDDFDTAAGNVGHGVRGTSDAPTYRDGCGDVKAAEAVVVGQLEN